MGKPHILIFDKIINYQFDFLYLPHISQMLALNHSVIPHGFWYIPDAYINCIILLLKILFSSFDFLCFLLIYIFSIKFTILISFKLTRLLFSPIFPNLILHILFTPLNIPPQFLPTSLTMSIFHVLTMYVFCSILYEGCYVFLSRQQLYFIFSQDTDF